MKAFALCVALAGFLLLRPYQLQQSGLLYAHDDEDYFAHATVLAYGRFPDYANEYFDRGDGSFRLPLGSIGSGLLASPFVFAFSLLDRAISAPIVKQRDRETIQNSWSAFGFVCATSFYFWIAALLLYRVLVRCVSPATAAQTLILLLIIQGVPLYVYRRPVFSHVYELFLQSALLASCAYRDRLNGFLPGILRAGILGAFIALTRVNNVHFAILTPWLIFGFYSALSNRQRIARIGAAYAISLVFGAVFKLWPILANQTAEPYLAVTGPFVQPVSASFLIHRVLHILFGLDWGLVFTAPFATGGIIMLLFRSLKSREIPFRRECLLLAAGLLLNVYLIARMGSHGAWYGYRNLIFSMIPIASIPLALSMEALKAKSARPRRLLTGLTGLVAIQPLLSMLLFEGNSTNLTLHPLAQWGWANLTYQLEIWRTLMHSPLEAAIALLKGGPLYILYLLSQLFQTTDQLPAIVVAKYSAFSGITLLKVAVLWIFPLCVFAILRRLKCFDPPVRYLVTKQ